MRFQRFSIVRNVLKYRLFIFRFSNQLFISISFVNSIAKANVYLFKKIRKKDKVKTAKIYCVKCKYVSTGEVEGIELYSLFTIIHAIFFINQLLTKQLMFIINGVKKSIQAVMVDNLKIKKIKMIFQLMKMIFLNMKYDLQIN